MKRYSAKRLSHFDNDLVAMMGEDEVVLSKFRSYQMKCVSSYKNVKLIAKIGKMVCFPAEVIFEFNDSVKYAIVDRDNSATIDIDSATMVGFSYDRDECWNFAVAMNYAISCGLSENQLQFHVDEMRYDVSCIAIDNLLDNLRIRTTDDYGNNIFLKNADETEIVIKYAVIDKQRSKSDFRYMVYFKSYDTAMDFAKAMNYVTLHNIP